MSGLVSRQESELHQRVLATGLRALPSPWSNTAELTFVLEYIVKSAGYKGLRNCDSANTVRSIPSKAGESHFRVNSQGNLGDL